jgi:sugar lactone lactonase YvrE
MCEFSHPEADRIAASPHYNDGKIGPDGAFYVGGMIGGVEGAGRLLRIAGDGSFSEPQVGAPPLTTPNGMHWMPTDSPSVWEFFYVCSQYPAIQRYLHDLETGKMTRQDDLIPLPRETFGYLDGMTGTQNGLLILALYKPVDYGCVVIDTATAKIIERISTTAPQTTSAIMHGSTIYVTTAAQEYGDSDYAEFPHAGDVFRCSARDAEHSLLRSATESTVQSGWVFRFSA